ncbi:hypothetical protein [Bacillus sp. FJAT-45066]|uniref:hypothetical protein n=1 Tax=Bacillus sp. FJAT-45066 TaxID=2011010 RepID=UPI000BB9ACDF|nr:hypothetical protein [Bacillus sp. FJAT-45066]
MTSTKTSKFTCFWFMVVDREQKGCKQYRVAQLIDYKNKSSKEVAKWFESLFQEYSVIKAGKGTIPNQFKEFPYINY